MPEVLIQNNKPNNVQPWLVRTIALFPALDNPSPDEPTLKREPTIDYENEDATRV